LKAGSSPPYRAAEFWEPEIALRKSENGVIYVEQKLALPGFPNRITEPLLDWARKAPDRTLFAARDENGAWKRLTFGDAVGQARSLGHRGVSQQRVGLPHDPRQGEQPLREARDYQRDVE